MRTLLHDAAERGDLTEIRRLVKQQGINVDGKDVDGLTATALHEAAWRGQIDAIRCLVKECNADVELQRKDGRVALHFAAENNHAEAIRCLVKECCAKVDSDDKDDNTALHCAARRGHVNAIRCLVKECNADVNRTNHQGWTALHAAAWEGHIDAVRCLVKECNADVNAVDLANCTALYRAAARGELDIVRFLVEACNANILISDNVGRNALEVAKFLGRKKVSDYLEKHIPSSLVSVQQYSLTKQHNHQKDNSEIKDANVLPVDTNNPNRYKESLMRRSVIDNNLHVTDNLYVVAIMRLENSTNEEHAFLIIEGINRIKRIDLCIDQQRKGEEYSKIKTKEKVLGSPDEKEALKDMREILGINAREDWRYLAWGITSTQLNQLEQDILKDQNDPPLYALSGDKSIFPPSTHSDSSTKRHNCFTWAREKLLKLENDIESEVRVITPKLQPKYTDWVAAKTSLYLPNPNTFWYQKNEVVLPALTVTASAAVVIAYKKDCIIQ